MAEHDRNAEPGGRPASEPTTPFDRFQSLTRRPLHVSKDDLREAEAREREKRQSA